MRYAQSILVYKLKYKIYTNKTPISTVQVTFKNLQRGVQKILEQANLGVRAGIHRQPSFEKIRIKRTRFRPFHLVRVIAKMFRLAQICLILSKLSVY